MRTPPRVIWSEGMFLSPQHLQSLDRYHEALLTQRLASVAPWGWGVADLVLDPAALAAGEIRVQRFAGALPGGLWIAFGENDPEAPPPRKVAEAFASTARTLEVWLAIPLERQGVVVAAPLEAEGPRPRLALVHRSVQDSMQPGAVASVPFGTPAASILLGKESREDYETIQIAEVMRTPAGGIALSEGFLPPLLRIGGTERLPQLLRDLVARLVARHRELAEGRRQRELAAGEVAGADVARMVQLVALGGAIPSLAHLAESLDATPREVYLALAALAGQLAAFTSEADVVGLPRFAPDDLRSTFEPLLTRINAYLGVLGLERFTRIPLEVRGLAHLASGMDELLLKDARFVLEVRSDIPELQVAEQLPRLCKIAAPSDVPALVQAAAPGLPLQVLHRPPPEIPVRAGTLYFEMGRSDRLWKTVLTERGLAIHLPPPFDPGRTQVALLAIPRK